MGLKTIFRNSIFSSSYIEEYKVAEFHTPKNQIRVDTAWKGLELIIEDIINKFDLKRDSCIEFGVEFGFSSVVFSNYFKNVIGIDTFEGDTHTHNKLLHYEQTKNRLANFENIQLIKSDYKDWISKDETHYNFAHVDIVHNYKETFECGLWAAEHSDCTIFHDTESFVDVRKAVIDISKKTGKRLYNYPLHHGLGILVSKK
jgi:hypothetical protein